MPHPRYRVNVFRKVLDERGEGGPSFFCVPHNPPTPLRGPVLSLSSHASTPLPKAPWERFHLKAPGNAYLWRAGMRTGYPE